MLEKGVIREAIHYKDQFVSHLFLASRKDGGQRPVINLKDFNTCIHTLQTFQDGKASSIKGNFGTRPLSMQVGPQRRLLLCFNSRGNMYVSNGRVPCTDSSVCVLDLAQPQSCLQN